MCSMQQVIQIQKDSFVAALGPRTGGDGWLSANAGALKFEMDSEHEVGADGLSSGVDAGVGVPNQADFNSGAHFKLDENSSAGTGLGLQFGRDELDGGLAIDTSGNTIISVAPRVPLCCLPDP